MKPTIKLGFLASHGGSAAKHLVAACQNGSLNAQAKALASNNSKSPALAWAREAGLKTAHISSAKHQTEADLDRALLDFLLATEVNTLVLSGYMKALGPLLTTHFAGRLVNIHPSLLPKHGGRGMYGDHVHRAVLAAADTETGATVHLVTAGIDEGPILAQQRVPVLATDTLETLKARVQSIESELMLRAIQSLA